MKKIRITALFLAIVLLFGCSSKAGQKLTVTFSSSLPDEISIATLDAFINSDNTVNEEAVTEWENYMSDLYGIQFDLYTNSSNSYDLYFQWDQIMYGSGKTGFFQMNSYFIQQLVKADKIEPLDEYLKDNKVWAGLPESYRKRFEYEGHIWAIPKSLNMNLQITSIRTDWLKAVGKEMPTSTAELAELGAALKNADPDGDGNSDNNYLLGDYFALFGDILAAYGIYVDDSSPFPLAYDPASKSIVDAMAQPGAKDALQYLKTLIQNGVIDPKSISAPNEAVENANKGLYGSVTGSVTTGKYDAGVTWAENNASKALGRSLDITKEEDYAYATGLYEAMPPLSDQYPVIYSMSDAGYVLAKGTKDPCAVANAFVDILLGSKQSFLDCYLGIPDHYSLKDDSVYVMKKNDATPYLTPGIITATSLLFDDQVAFVFSGEYDKAAVRLQKDRTAYKKAYLERYTKTGQLVEVPALSALTSETLDIYEGSVWMAFQKLLLSLLNDNITVEQALAEYHTSMDSYQIETILQELNANTGKTVAPK